MTKCTQEDLEIRTYHLFTYSVPYLGLPWLGVLAGPGLAYAGKPCARPPPWTCSDAGKRSARSCRRLLLWGGSSRSEPGQAGTKDFPWATRHAERCIRDARITCHARRPMPDPVSSQRQPRRRRDSRHIPSTTKILPFYLDSVLCSASAATSLQTALGRLCSLGTSRRFFSSRVTCSNSINLQPAEKHTANLKPQKSTWAFLQAWDFFCPCIQGFTLHSAISLEKGRVPCCLRHRCPGPGAPRTRPRSLSDLGTHATERNTGSQALGLAAAHLRQSCVPSKRRFARSGLLAIHCLFVLRDSAGPMNLHQVVGPQLVRGPHPLDPPCEDHAGALPNQDG